MSQGQSAITPGKEHAFGGLFHMSLAVARKFPHAFHHFDLNAGSGFNDKADCKGSPLVFLETAARLGIENFWAHFVDRDRRAVEELTVRVAEQPRAIVYHGENREFVGAIPQLVRWGGGSPSFALGMVVCDPNGTDLPWSELAELSRVCPRLDFVFNYSSTTWKRVRGAGFLSADLKLESLLEKLNKKHWLIQCPLSSDPQEWMILAGSNFEFQGWKKQRFYKLDSPEGRECLRRSLTRSESTQQLF